MSSIEIHKNFKIAPFDHVDHNETNERMKINNKPFIYECQYLEAKSTVNILKEYDEIIQTMFKEWKQESEQLSTYFRERNRKLAFEPMIRGLANFISITTWINNQMLSTLENLLADLDQLLTKPINLQERITFVLKQPDHYHSYIQLSGLYNELEKLYYKQKITSSK